MFKQLSRYRAISYWLLAAGLHSVLLLIPLSFENEVSPENEAPPISEQPVRVVKLTSPRRANQVSTAPTTQPRLVSPLRPARVKTTQHVTAPRPAPLVVKPSPLAQPTPVAQVVPTPQPSQSPPSPPEPPEKLPKPKPTLSTQTPPTSTNLENKLPELDPLKELAGANGTQQSCDETKATCWRVEDSQWRAVSQELREQLESRGYQVRPLDLEDDIGMAIFEVSKRGKRLYYLHFLSLEDQGGGTAYLRADQVLSRDELRRRVNGSHEI